MDRQIGYRLADRYVCVLVNRSSECGGKSQKAKRKASREGAGRGRMKERQMVIGGSQTKRKVEKK